METAAFGIISTVYPKKYAHGFCFALLCCGYTLTDFPISIRLTSLALWQSNDCPSASKATLMNMDKYFMWIHYERLHNHNKAKHNKTVCIFLGIYCRYCLFLFLKILLIVIRTVWISAGIKQYLLILSCFTDFQEIINTKHDHFHACLYKYPSVQPYQSIYCGL